MPDTRIPVTLLTGFLGAGKSTLLNKVLSHEGGERLAIIVNEFGDIGLDHDLIETSDEDITLLSSGCICCSIRGDLASTIPSLLSRRARGKVAFDRIVIETTGLAEPAPIQTTLVGEAILARSVVMDGIVTVADALHGTATFDAHFESVSQIAMADLVLVSKGDLVSADEMEAFHARVKRINGTADIVDTGTVADDPSVMWGRSAVKHGMGFDAAMAWMAPKPAAADPMANLSGMAASKPVAMPVATHNEGRVTSAAILLDRPIKRGDLADWLEDLQQSRGDSVLRVKGIVFLEGEGAPLVFHGVQHTYDQPAPLETWDPDDMRSRIVVIARDISQTRLQRILDKLA